MHTGIVDPVFWEGCGWWRVKAAEETNTQHHTTLLKFFLPRLSQFLVEFQDKNGVMKRLHKGCFALLWSMLAGVGHMFDLLQWLIGWIIAKYDLNTGRTKMGFTWCRSLFFVIPLVFIQICTSHGRINLCHFTVYHLNFVPTPVYIIQCHFKRDRSEPSVEFRIAFASSDFVAAWWTGVAFKILVPRLECARWKIFPYMSHFYTVLVGRIKTEWKGQFHGWNVEIVLLMHEDKFKKKIGGQIGADLKTATQQRIFGASGRASLQQRAELLHAPWH